MNRAGLLFIAGTIAASFLYCTDFEAAPTESVADASSDTTTSSDSAPSPSSRDAQAETSAPASCPFVSWGGRIVLCEDFDATNPFAAWSTLVTGEAEIDASSMAISAPSAFLARVGAISAAGAEPNSATLRRPITMGRSTRIDFQLHVEPKSGGAVEHRAVVLSLGFTSRADAGPPRSGTLDVSLVRYSSGQALVELQSEISGVVRRSLDRMDLAASVYTPLTLTVTYPFGALAAHLEGPSGTLEPDLELSIDDLGGKITPGEVPLSIGLSTQSTNDTEGNLPWAVSIDDLSAVTDD